MISTNVVPGDRSKRRSKTPNTNETMPSTASSKNSKDDENEEFCCSTLDKFKTWPAKSSSLDVNESFRNLAESEASPSLRKSCAKSRANSFESAQDDLNSALEEPRLATVTEDNVGFAVFFFFDITKICSIKKRNEIIIIQ